MGDGGATANKGTHSIPTRAFHLEEGHAILFSAVSVFPSLKVPKC